MIVFLIGPALADVSVFVIVGPPGGVNVNACRPAFPRPCSAKPSTALKLNTSWEEHSSAARLEVMPYSTYEDARAREAELLRLARKSTVGSVPRRERRPSFRPSRILQFIRGRHGAAQKPAVGRA